MKRKEINWKRLEVVFEFLIFGILIGITEDLIAIKIATNEPITKEIIGIIILIAIPFAIIGEVVADNVDFTGFLKRLFKRLK